MAYLKDDTELAAQLAVAVNISAQNKAVDIHPSYDFVFLRASSLLILITFMNRITLKIQPGMTYLRIRNGKLM